MKYLSLLFGPFLQGSFSWFVGFFVSWNLGVKFQVRPTLFLGLRFFLGFENFLKREDLGWLDSSSRRSVFHSARKGLALWNYSDIFSSELGKNYFLIYLYSGIFPIFTCGKHSEILRSQRINICCEFFIWKVFELIEYWLG